MQRFSRVINVKLKIISDDDANIEFVMNQIAEDDFSEWTNYCSGDTVIELQGVIQEPLSDDILTDDNY